RCPRRIVAGLLSARIAAKALARPTLLSREETRNMPTPDFIALRNAPEYSTAPTCTATVLALVAGSVPGHDPPAFRAQGCIGGESIHQARDSGAFLGHGDKDLARRVVLEQAHGDVAFVAADGELVRDGLPFIRKLATDRPVHDLLDRSRCGGRAGHLGPLRRT